MKAAVSARMLVRSIVTDPHHQVTGPRHQVTGPHPLCQLILNPLLQFLKI